MRKNHADDGKGEHDCEKADIDVMVSNEDKSKTSRFTSFMSVGLTEDGRTETVFLAHDCQLGALMDGFKRMMKDVPNATVEVFTGDAAKIGDRAKLAGREGNA